MSLRSLEKYAKKCKKRASKATPGPWLVNEEGDCACGQTHIVEAKVTLNHGASGEVDDSYRRPITYCEPMNKTVKADIRDHTFIAMARYDVPALADALLKTIKKLKKLKKKYE